MRTKLIKVVSLLLMISLLTVSTSVVVIADTSAPFILESSEVKKGEVTVSVVCNVSSGCYALKGKFSTNTPGFTLASIELQANDLFEGTESGDFVVTDEASGSVAWVDVNFDNGIADGKTIVTATYTVADDIAPGTYTFTFTPSVYVDGSDDAYVEYTEVLDTTVTVEDKPAGLKGDVNGDGLITSADLTALARHVGGIESITDETLLANADVNGDTTVTSADLTKHARYVGGIITDWSQD